MPSEATISDVRTGLEKNQQGMVNHLEESHSRMPVYHSEP